MTFKMGHAPLNDGFPLPSLRKLDGSIACTSIGWIENQAPRQSTPIRSDEHGQRLLPSSTIRTVICCVSSMLQPCPFYGHLAPEMSLLKIPSKGWDAPRSSSVSNVITAGLPGSGDHGRTKIRIKRKIVALGGSNLSKNRHLDHKHHGGCIIMKNIEAY